MGAIRPLHGPIESATPSVATDFGRMLGE